MTLYSPLMSFTEKMLDVTALRHRVLSNNIANLNTAGFKRSEVSFSTALEQIKKSLHDDPTDLEEMTKESTIDDAILENMSLEDLYHRAKVTGSGGDSGVIFALADATFDHKMRHHPASGVDDLLASQQKKDKGISRQDIIASTQPELVIDQAAGRMDGNNVEPEVEVSRMIKNTSFYNILVSALSGEFRTLKTIISNR